jgi:hypothetical protein
MKPGSAARRERQAEADAWLAAHLAAVAAGLTPRSLALPLLGIPGVTPDSESADYYRIGGSSGPASMIDRMCAPVPWRDGLTRRGAESCSICPGQRLVPLTTRG